jgi:hypothetical protein
MAVTSSRRDMLHFGGGTAAARGAGLSRAAARPAWVGSHQIPGLASRRQSHRCPWDGAVGQRQRRFERSAARPGTNFLPQAPCTHTNSALFPFLAGHPFNRHNAPFR